MKKNIFFTFALLCLPLGGWGGLWAQTSVSTDSELRAAIQNDGANIILGTDITLSSDLTIDDGKSVTIDLYGHKLDRGLGNASTMSSGVIYIKQGGSLTINDSSPLGDRGAITGGYAYKGGGILNWGTLVVNGGTISGNRAGDEGGGIFNFGTATINGGTISSNTALGNGGGISNSGTLTVNGGFIAGNTTNAFGGGIANGATLTLNGGYITGNNAYGAGGGIWMGSYQAFNVQGAVTVTGNTTAGGLANNLYFADNKVITVTGSLTGSSIGISTETEGKFTNGYSTHNSGVDPTTYFIVDNTFFHIIDSEGEAYLSHGPQDVVYYYERSWDDDNQTVIDSLKTISHKIGYTDIPGEGDYKEVTSASDDDWFALGGYNNDIHEYYVVRGIVHHNTLFLLGKNVHLILCDDAKITLSGGILTYGDRKLYIHSQSYGSSMGKLIAESGYDDEVAGIGSDCEMAWNAHWSKSGYYGDVIDWGSYEPVENSRIPADLEIHGGDIYAQGSKQAAGIGGGDSQPGGNLVIYGGKITAKGGEGDSNGEGGAGFGGGGNGDAGSIKIYSGIVEAWGGRRGAGIGSGIGKTNGTIEIYGGNVEAHGGKNSPGIGAGALTQDITVTINGGIVKAYGDENGAGIGGGKNGSGYNNGGGTININGGEVYAYGGEDAAGIGGGWNGDGGDVTISGGYVYAKGDGNGAGIGSGSEEITRINPVHGGTLTVTGGEVYAYGGVDAAGIGGGEDADGGTVNISGGYVYAEGNDYGSGIGGGQDGDGGNITITGGIVIAKAGANAPGAIGGGEDGEHGSLTLGDDRCVYITNGLWRCKKESRVNDCWGAAYVQISECLHGGATASVVNGDKHNLTDCQWCYVTSEDAHDFGEDSQCATCQLIRLVDEGDNTALFTKWADGDAHDFLLSGRKLEANSPLGGTEGASRAYTVCLPFDMDLTDRTDDLSLWTLSYIKDGSEMVFTRVLENKVEAGKPYLIVINQGELELLSRNVPLAVTNSPLGGTGGASRVYDWDNKEQPVGWWRGTLTKIESADAADMMAYALQSVGDFRRIRHDTPYAWWGAFRSMYCPDEQPGTNILTINRGTLGGFGGNAPDLTFAGDAEIDGETTGISLTTNPSPKGEGSDYYSIDGRKLNSQFSILNSQLKKGVYIYKGKKVVIK